jgi:MazG family protein
MRRFQSNEPRPLPELPEQEGETFVRLAGLMRRLLDEDGCPWDREQTLVSLKQYLREEAAEVLDAIDAGDAKNHCEELGDLLFQVVFQTEITRRAGQFGLDDVVEGIVAKLVRRHPHVFGDARGTSPDASISREEIRKNWESIKAEEKGPRKTLDGIPKNLPALMRADAIGRRAAAVGFDWSSSGDSWDKVREEQEEFFRSMQSRDREHPEAEFGDVLFALVNYARHVGIDAERALQRTNEKFVKRFAHVEAKTLEKHGSFEPATLEEMDGYWNEAKRMR